MNMKKILFVLVVLVVGVTSAWAQLPQVTLQGLVDFAKHQVADKPYRYIILGDEKELDMKALEKIGPVKRLTTEEIFGY